MLLPGVHGSISGSQLLLEAREFQAAEQQFRQVVEQDPEHLDAIYSLGLLALEVERYDAAGKRFERLLELGGRTQESRYYLGRINEAQDAPESAIEWYDRVREGDYLLHFPGTFCGLSPSGVYTDVHLLSCLHRFTIHFVAAM